jgi:hypothetical protein
MNVNEFEVGDGLDLDMRQMADCSICASASIKPIPCDCFCGNSCYLTCVELSVACCAWFEPLEPWVKVPDTRWVSLP